jgi:hypothetical protein
MQGFLYCLGSSKEALEAQIILLNSYYALPK